MRIEPVDLLPLRGNLVLCYGHDTPDRTFATADADEFTHRAAELDAEGYSVWMARSSFTGNRRLAKDVSAVSAFSIDIDIEPSGVKNGKACYASQSAALKALQGLVASGHTPAPSVVVSSGTGLHIWWRLTEDCSAAAWKAVADRMKNAVKKADAMLAADTARWTDPNGLLRPWPSTNRKGGALTPVRALASNDAAYTLEEFASYYPPQSKPAAAINALAVPPATTASKRRKLDDGERKFPPTRVAPADAIASCAVLKHHIDRRIAVASEPEWHAVLTAVAFMKPEYRDNVAHLVSKSYPGYSFDETDSKFERIKTAVDNDEVGPPSCSTLRELVTGAANNRSLCKGCPLAAQPSESNINFLRAVQEKRLAATAAVPASTADKPRAPAAAVVHDAAELEDIIGGFEFPEYIGREVESNEPFYLAEMPDGNMGLYGVLSKGGAALLFNPAWWVERHFGDKSAVVFSDGQQLRRGIIPRSSLSAPSLLYPRLAALGLAIEPARDKVVAEAVNRYCNLVQRCAPEGPLALRCGLSDSGDSFTFGPVSVDKDGELSRALPGDSHARAVFDAIRFTGDLASAVVNMRGAVAAGHYTTRFVIGAALGSPLLALTSLTGCIVNLVGSRDAGKTMALIAAAQCFGNADTYINHGSDTVLNSTSRAAALGSLPLMIDEATLMRDEHLSDAVYMLAMGRAKRANNIDGTTRAIAGGWRLTTFMTSNRPIRDTLSRVEPDAAVAAAKQARLIELTVPPNAFRAIGDRTEFVRAMQENSGLLALQFIRHMMRHRERLADRMKEAIRVVERQGSHTARFIAHTVASYIVATEEMRDMGWWPLEAKDDDDVIVRVIRGTDTDIASAETGRFEGLAERFMSMAYPHLVLLREQAADGKLVTSHIDTAHIPVAVGRAEIRAAGTDYFLSRQVAAGIVRRLLDPRAAPRLLTAREASHFLGVLRDAGMVFDDEGSPRRLGAGAGPKLAMSPPVRCIRWTGEGAPASGSKPFAVIEGGRQKLATS